MSTRKNNMFPALAALFGVVLLNKQPTAPAAGSPPFGGGSTGGSGATGSWTTISGNTTQTTNPPVINAGGGSGEVLTPPIPYQPDNDIGGLPSGYSMTRQMRHTHTTSTRTTSTPQPTDEALKAWAQSTATMINENRAQLRDAINPASPNYNAAYAAALTASGQTIPPDVRSDDIYNVLKAQAGPTFGTPDYVPPTPFV